MTVHALADLLSTAINPALVLLVLEEPLLGHQGRQEPWPRFWGRSALSIGAAVGLAEAGKHYQIWPGHPLFPSGHMTFATAAASCLMLRRGLPWLGIALPLIGIMGISLVVGGWHTGTEVFGGLALGGFITLVCFGLLRQARRPGWPGEPPAGPDLMPQGKFGTGPGTKPG
ncbi:MAG: phosphatase PAP2 family protein [Cytophagales bacterium]|nr:phosphatase PAP2 family protein [Armatimonadota bacterium]